jgi:fatty-acyl-CoA synthase
VEFIDEVPKTSVGKFSKKTLREKFGGYQVAGPHDSADASGT